MLPPDPVCAIFLHDRVGIASDELTMWSISSHAIWGRGLRADWMGRGSSRKGPEFTVLVVPVVVYIDGVSATVQNQAVIGVEIVLSGSSRVRVAHRVDLEPIS